MKLHSSTEPGETASNTHNAIFSVDCGVEHKRSKIILNK